MVSLVEAALAIGACGGSSGLEYTPGGSRHGTNWWPWRHRFAGAGFPYSTHMRNEDDRLLDSIDEALAVAETAGARCRLPT